MFGKTDQIHVPAGVDWCRLERIVARFEAACARGPWPSIEPYLPADGDRRAVLIELIHVDLELRLRADEPVEVASYLERFPELAVDPEVERSLLAFEAGLRARTSPELGTRFGRFELLEVVGQGAHAVVYRGIDHELARPVAVKVLKGGGSATADSVQRFFREARHLAYLRHPGIVSVHEAGQCDGTRYLVSEFIEGTTLTELIEAGRPSPQEAAELVAKAADALAHAHGQGIVHRDVKPSNILIDAQGSPRLADFGLARRDDSDATLTLDGQVLGTPAYMSPEQARGEARAVDARSDLYSLGVVLYELLTGEVPFQGSPRRLLVQVLEQAPLPPRQRVESVPRDLERICLKAMAKRPEDRYATANDLADDLRRFLRGEPARARPPGQTARLRHRGRRQPLVAALVVAGLVMAWQARVSFNEARRQRARFLQTVQDSSEVTATMIRLGRQRTGTVLTEPDLQPILAKLQRRIKLLQDDPETLPMLAAAHSQAATLLRMAGRPDDALASLRQCVKARQRHADESPDDPVALLELARALDRLDAGCRAAGKIDEAGRLTFQTLDVERRAVLLLRERTRDSPGLPRHWSTLANAYARLTSLLIKTERPAEAVKMAREAWECWNLASTTCPDSAAVRTIKINTCNHVIDYYVDSGQIGLAIPDLVRLRQLRTDVLQDNPGDPKPWLALAKDSLRLADARYAVGLWSEAKADYERLRADLERERGRGPLPSLQNERLALAWVGIGRIEDRHDHPAEAVAAFQRAGELFEQLSRDHPEIIPYEQSLAMCHHVIGNLLIDLDQPAKAIVSYHRALRIREDLARAFPDSAVFQSDQAGTRLRLSEAQAALVALAGLR